MEFPHLPVLVDEVPEYLLTVPDGIYVDGTVGSGGHSEAIGKRITARGRLICLDRDSEAIRLSRKRLTPLGERVTLVRANYADLDQILRDLRVRRVQGIFLDLGMSTYQLDHSGRGFSFHRDEPLDMRMDSDDEVTAYRLINTRSPGELEILLRNYGEERKARRIANAIVRERKRGPIHSSRELANLVSTVVPRTYGPGSKHPATRTFQALRIAVNRELESLNIFLNKTPSLISGGGRLVVISYHSLEDRMVKQAMAGWERGCTCPPDLPRCACGKGPLFRRIRKRGVKAGKKEVGENPRARSATLRAAERI